MTSAALTVTVTTSEYGTIVPQILVHSSGSHRDHMARIYRLAAAVELASGTNDWVVTASRYGVAIELVTETDSELALACDALRAAVAS